MHILRQACCTTAGLVLLLAALHGCGSAEHSGSVGHSGRAAPKRPPDAAALALADMVNAVPASGKPSGDIELKFTLRQRPVVGESVDIDLALIPGPDIDRVYAAFQAADGLELTKGAKTAEIEHPPAGVAISHTLSIVPQRDGVFYVSAIVLADSAMQSVTRSFSIPVIVGAGSAPTAAATGEPNTVAAPVRGH
jgi:hypothetical protein